MGHPLECTINSCVHKSKDYQCCIIIYVYKGKQENVKNEI